MATNAPATEPVATKEDFISLIKRFFDQPVLQIVPEIAHISPIIFTVGTAFISLVSLNYSLGIFAASSFEALLVYNVLHLVSSYFATPFTPGKTPDAKCQSYFQILTPSRFKSLMESGLTPAFPNKALYFLSFAAAYCFQSMNFFSEEVSNFGPQYSNRPYISFIGASMFLALYGFFLISYGCDSIFTIFFTILFGILIGVLISYQNKGILGKDAVNVLFIPSLQQRKGMDYICVTSQ